MTGIQESAFAIKAPAKRRKRIFLPLALSGAVIVIGIGGYFLYQEWGRLSSSSEEAESILLESTPMDSRSTAPIIEVFETESDKLAKSYNNGDYSEAIRIAQSILTKDKQNREALDYLAKARGKLSESRIARYISVGKRDYVSGNFEQCKINMEQALKINGKNAEARRYFDLADKALSEDAIRQIVERQRKAEEQKDLLVFLSDIGPEALAAKKRADALQLFNNYDDINSRISGLAIDFIDSDHADVSFSHLLVAVDKKSKQSKVIFEGKKALILEKIENTWKILVYR